MSGPLRMGGAVVIRAWQMCGMAIAVSLAATSSVYPCTRTTPVSVADMVSQADAIVRARALAAVDGPRPQPRRDREGTVRFDVLEVLKGDRQLSTVALAGQLVDRDDFNDHSPPYQVRPSGRAGSCFTDEYRGGAEYLLVLKRDADAVPWTTRWYPLGPVNEQLVGANDPWLEWVRANVK